jgi:ABC-type oligopeptide transport system substrate-binding subunit
MKNNTQKPLFVALALMLAAALTLTACTSSTPTSAASAGSTPVLNSSTAVPAATSVQAAATATTATAASSSTCLTGTWNLTDFSSYMNSIEQNTSNASGSTVTVSSQDFTGKAQFTFGDYGTATLSADTFEQKFTLSTDVGGTKLDIPITLDINGHSTAKYTVDGDKVSFNGQDNSGMTITVVTMGTSNPIDQSLLGANGTIQLYQYACPDANTLTLKVIAVTNSDFAPLTLTRAQ